MRRALASAAAVTGIGATAILGGVATQPAVPAAAPVVLAADDFDEDDPVIVELWAELTRAAIGADEWDRITGDGS